MVMGLKWFGGAERTEHLVQATQTVETLGPWGH